MNILVLFLNHMLILGPLDIIHITVVYFTAARAEPQYIHIPCIVLSRRVCQIARKI